MSNNSTNTNRVSVKGTDWKKAISISADKFDQVSAAILTVLPEDPIRFSELSKLVESKLPHFDGSVSWYTVSVARELETQGKLVRHIKPVRYSRAS